MENIKMQGESFPLQGKIALEGKKLDFKAVDREGKDFHLSSIATKKIISVYPKLNTSVCDKQTKWISENAQKYPSVEFISISMDSVDTINEWCGAHGVDNILIVSDEKYQDFGQKTGAYIPKLKLLARGFIILDENNLVKKQLFKEEITDDPDYEILTDLLKTTI